ncbi:phosphoenolpyruvate--protein phosphotransferase, partial [Candidatus Aerophobetes bacterium]
MPKGIAASPGIAMGKAYILEKEEYCILEYKIKKEEVEQELKRFETAVENSKKDLGKIKKRVEEEMGEKEAYIFQAHLYILEDPLFIQDITRRIKRQRLNAETAVRRTLEVFEAKFASARAEFVRRRFGDVEDVGGHILRNLLKRPTLTLSHLEEDIIVVADDLAPSDTASMQKGRILGFATNVGGRTSHSAIMARSM